MFHVKILIIPENDMIFSKKMKALCYLSGLLLRPALSLNFFPIFEQNNTFITINN